MPPQPSEPTTKGKGAATKVVAPTPPTDESKVGPPPDLPFLAALVGPMLGALVTLKGGHLPSPTAIGEVVKVAKQALDTLRQP